VIVQADRGLRYQAVAEILAQVRDAGFARFDLAAARVGVRADRLR
jgi:biopolymer transport protein ExbD